MKLHDLLETHLDIDSIMDEYMEIMSSGGREFSNQHKEKLDKLINPLNLKTRQVVFDTIISDTDVFDSASFNFNELIFLVDLCHPDITKVLTNLRFIKYHPDEYAEFVKRYFKNNTLLMNKWLRYVKNIQEQS